MLNNNVFKVIGGQNVTVNSGYLNKKSLGYISQMSIHVNRGKILFTGKGILEAYKLSKIFKKVVFIGFSPNKKFLKICLDKKFTIYGLPKYINEFKNSTWKPFKLFIKALQNLISVFTRLTSIILHEKLDLLRVENISLVGFPTFLVSLLSRRKFILWIGGLEKDVLKLKLNTPISQIIIFLFDLICRMVVRKACYVLTVFPNIKEYLLRLGARKLTILDINFVDIDILKPSTSNEEVLKEKSGKMIVLYVGRLEKEKGVCELIKAMAKVCKVIKNAELWIVGDGTLREKLKKLAKQIGVPTKFWGRRDIRELSNFYYAADIFVLPSLVEESAPAALLEAMACKLAVISTSSLIKRCKGCGIFVPMGNTNMLANTIIKLLRDKDLRRKIGNRASEFVKKFSKEYLEATYKAYAECFK